MQAIADIVAGHVDARAAEDHVGAIGTLGGAAQAEEVGAAADDVILPEITEDHVGAAAALDVIVAVARGLHRSLE